MVERKIATETKCEISVRRKRGNLWTSVDAKRKRREGVEDNLNNTGAGFVVLASAQPRRIERQVHEMFTMCWWKRLAIRYPNCTLHVASTSSY